MNTTQPTSSISTPELVLLQEQVPSVPPIASEFGPEYVLHNHYQELEDLKEQIVRSMRNSKLGLHKGECRVSRPVITTPQKGQTPFEIDGVMVWAGSLKAAIKKAKKLAAQRGPTTAAA